MLRWDLMMELKFWDCWTLLVYSKSSNDLYRADGLRAINNANVPKLDIIRKDIIALFKKEALSITMEKNLFETHFLDVTFNFAKKVKIFWKAKNTPLYTNVFSIHPPITMKQFPKMINKRIADLSCNNKELHKVESTDESAPKDKGLFSSMSYDNSNTQSAQRNRNRKVNGSTSR